MITSLRGAGCAVIAGSLCAFSAQAVEVVVAAKVTALGSYAIEVEVQDFFNADTIDLVHPVFGSFPLAFDSGENNWDVVGEDLDFVDIEDFFNTTFDLEINNNGSQSIYRGESVGAPGPGDFPEPASFLTVDDSPTPTAQWAGGDNTADAMIITYAIGDDEFSDGFEPAEEDSSRTLSFPLEPGFYEVTLGFYFDFGLARLDLITGDDVLDLEDFNLVSVGETFSGTTVVPAPAAAWLLLSGLGALVTIRRRHR